ncbi:hypothetical protein FLGE108171_05570 [Flavobacterium gelidilacus]|uniref:hypothetical protein n=1 Tax=Flavobacterium gelidilacus TaxID=206041 RepID=UPI000402C21D|nr:hypothetical protein [Flavobacterium gelidilacus]
MSFKYFYLAPLINIKQISFFTQKGIATVNYNLTLDENDSVTNKEPFVDYLKTKKAEATNIFNLLELYKFYKSFAHTSKNFT